MSHKTPLCHVFNHMLINKTACIFDPDIFVIALLLKIMTKNIYIYFSF